MTADLAAGAELLQRSLNLAHDPHSLYKAADDTSRGHINQAFFTALYLDEQAEIDDATWTSPFVELRAIHSTWLQLRRLHRNSRPDERRTGNETGLPHRGSPAFVEPARSGR
ncbi:hypothetical protein [Nocardioides convexus]|uniref:hypothetical protein n=1 Tax=Nocardioides convexus TaxID=2712224 RepID=UPI002418A387|nr:hypothetical protein [Nocardioides convexus]